MRARFVLSRCCCCSCTAVPTVTTVNSTVPNVTTFTSAAVAVLTLLSLLSALALLSLLSPLLLSYPPTAVITITNVTNITTVISIAAVTTIITGITITSATVTVLTLGPLQQSAELPFCDPHVLTEAGSLHVLPVPAGRTGDRLMYCRIVSTGLNMASSCCKNTNILLLLCLSNRLAVHVNPKQKHYEMVTFVLRN